MKQLCPASSPRTHGPGGGLGPHQIRPGQAPQRCDFRCACGMLGIRRVGRLLVGGLLTSCRPSTFQAALRNPFQQLFTRANCVFSQVPTESASLRRRAPRWAGNLPKTPQHAAAFVVVHRPLNGRAGLRGRSQGGCTRPAGLRPSGNRSCCCSSTRPVRARRCKFSPAGQRTRVLVGGHHALHTTARQHRQTVRPCLTAANIKGESLAGRRLRDQITYSPRVRRNAVVRVNAVTRRCAQGGYFTPFLRHSWAPTRPAAHAAKPPRDSRWRGPRPQCRPGAGRARGAAQSCNRLPARSAPTTAPAHAAPAPAGAGETLPQGGRCRFCAALAATLRGLRSARRISACSNMRAFWKSPVHNKPVPSQAMR